MYCKNKENISQNKTTALLNIADATIQTQRALLKEREINLGYTASANLDTLSPFRFSLSRKKGTFLLCFVLPSL